MSSSAALKKNKRKLQGENREIQPSKSNKNEKGEQEQIVAGTFVHNQSSAEKLPEVERQLSLEKDIDSDARGTVPVDRVIFSECIWYQVVDAYGLPYKGTDMSSIRRVAGINVDMLRKEIKATHPNKLKSYDPSDFQCYVSLKKKPLAANYLIKSLDGCDANTPFIIRVPTDLLEDFPVPVNQDWKYGRFVKRMQSEVLLDFNDSPKRKDEKLFRRTLSLSRFGIMIWSYLKKKADKIFEGPPPTFKLPLEINENDCTAWISSIPFGNMQSLLLLCRTRSSESGVCFDQESQFIEDIVKRIPAIELPGSVTQLEKYTSLFKTLFLFKSSDRHRPEEQFRSHLWMPLLELFFSDNVFLRSNPEFKMTSIPGYLNGYACDLNWYINPAICKNFEAFAPLFLVEVAGPPIKDDQEHKDLQKLACEMWASALYYIGLLRNSSECQKNIRIYGAYVSGTQIQFCVLAPLFSRRNFNESIDEEEESDIEIEFVFQTSKEWIFDLSSDSCKRCAEDCEQCCRTDAESKLYNNPYEMLMEFQSRNTLTNANFPKNIDMTDEKGQLYSLPKGFKDYHAHRLNNGLVSAVIAIERMAKCVKNYADLLFCCLEKHERLGAPMKIDEKLSRAALQIRDSHAADTPYKPGTKKNKSVPRNSGGSRSRGNQDQIEESSLQLFENTIQITILGKIDCYFRKNKSIYRCVDASGVIPCCLKIETRGKERSFPAIVKFPQLKRTVSVYYQDIIVDGGEQFVATVEEWLVQPLTGKYLRSAPIQELIPLAFEYWLDGLYALIELRDTGIIHRDISPFNFMFSSSHQRWKLLDFESASFVNDNDDFSQSDRVPDSQMNTCKNSDSDCYESTKIINHNQFDYKIVLAHKLIGTEGFIAPEILEARARGEVLPYSFASDLFSFAASVIDTILFHCVDVCETLASEESEEYRIAYCLEKIARRCLQRYPLARKTLEELLEETLELMTDFLRTFGRNEDFSHAISNMRFRSLVYDKLLSKRKWRAQLVTFACFNSQPIINLTKFRRK